MSLTIFKNRCNSRTQGVISLADQVMQDHHLAMSALDVQEAVAEGLDHQKFLCDIVKDSLQAAIEDRIEDLDSHGQFLVDIFDQSVDAFARLMHAVGEVESAGHHVERAREFRGGYSEVRKLRDRIRRNWPTSDSSFMQRSLQEFQNGEWESVDTIIDKLQRCDSQSGAKED